MIRAFIAFALLLGILSENTPLTLTHAPQTAAPALAPLNDGSLLTSWIGVDARGVHHDARRIFEAQQGEIVTLPLPPRRPFAPTLVPAQNGAHLFWLDANDADILALHSALITPDLRVERGPVEVSDGLALRSAAIADDNGGAWTAFIGGSEGEPTLLLRAIDPAGRPLERITVMTDADHPAFARAADGTLWLFWIASGQVWRGRVNETVVEDVEAITGTLALAPADRLENLSAGIDGRGWGYVFWNVTRADSTRESYYSRGLMDSTAWYAPERLRQGDTLLHAVAPAVPPPGRGFDTLAVAAADDTGMLITYWRGGELIAASTAATNAQPLSQPTLQLTQGGDVYLAWAELDGDTAALKLLTIG